MDKITYEESLKKDSLVYVDVRTPKEYNESTIPGAINLPVLNNDEREKIGRIYHKKSPAKAKMTGVEYVSPKIPDLIKKIRDLRANYNYVVIFCSRGNLRSESIVTFTELAGLKAFQLKGGYKAYRHFILDQLENYKFKPELLVIHGYTGVGKTDLLYKLKESGIKIIDLEGLANHRGSAFGGIGLKKPTNQKMFDSLLWEKLEKLKEEKIIAVEAESRKVGMSTLPDFFFEKMENGRHILIESSINRRIERIYSEYALSYQKNTNIFIKDALTSIRSVKKYLIRDMGKDKYKHLTKLCGNGRLKKVIEILLKNYYDPLYRYQQKKQDDFALTISSDDIEIIRDRLIRYLRSASQQV